MAVLPTRHTKGVIAIVSHCTGLKSLNVNQMDLSDASCEAIRRHSLRLSILHAYRNNFSDAGADYLSGIATLAELDLRENEVRGGGGPGGRRNCIPWRPRWWRRRQ